MSANLKAWLQEQAIATTLPYQTALAPKPAFSTSLPARTPFPTRNPNPSHEARSWESSTQPIPNPPQCTEDESEDPRLAYPPSRAIEHNGTHLQFYRDGRPTPYYVPAKRGRMYPTATAQRTDSMIWPPRGTEMSGWERIEEMMRGGENERGRVDEGNQGAEGSCDDGLWNGDPPKVGSKGFEEIPLEVLSKRQKKRWAMLYQALSEDDEWIPASTRARGELRRLQKIAELIERA